MLCTICILPALLSCHSTHSPISAFSVSSNGRYLVQTDGTPFYWLADTEWVLNKHSDDQVHAILDDRAAKGFTVIQVFATRMAWDRSWSLTNAWDFDLSWANSDANDQYPFVDGRVTSLNPPYWQRWNWIIDEAAKRNLYVLMLIGEPGTIETFSPIRSTSWASSVATKPARFAYASSSKSRRKTCGV